MLRDIALMYTHYLVTGQLNTRRPTSSLPHLWCFDVQW